MSGTAKIRVVIAEKQKLFRLGLGSLIQSIGDDLEICGESDDGAQTIEIVHTLKPDILCLDLCLLGLNGVDVIRSIKKQQPNIKIIVVTAHKDEHDVRLALGAGADAYVLKEDSSDDVTQAVRAVLRGKQFLSPGVCGTVVSHFLERTGGEGGPAGSDTRLTTRERQVLKLVAEGRKNREIADLLSISIKTVEKHRTSLMKKLDLHNAAELTSYAIRHRYVDPDVTHRPGGQ
jgi:DNA-binding NarL/FixJ family response regulator